MNSHGELVVCGGRSNPELVNGICRSLSIPVTPIEFVDFSNGNIKVTIGANVRNRHVYVVQSGARGGIDNRFITKLDIERRSQILMGLLDKVEGITDTERSYLSTLFETVLRMDHVSGAFSNKDFIELLIIIDALKYSSADKITAVMPYMPYVRSDKKEEGRISVTAKLVAKLVETAGADRVIVVDFHAPQIMHYFDIKTDQLFAEPLFFEFVVQSALKDFVVVAGDQGMKYIRRIARLLWAAPVVFIHKERQDDSEHGEILTVTGDVSVEGKDCLVFDDEGLTMNTLLDGVDVLVERGAKSVYAFLTHLIASNGAIERIAKSKITKLVTTDTVQLPDDLPDKIRVISIAPILARVIRRIEDGRSISSLIDELRDRALTGQQLIG